MFLTPRLMRHGGGLALCADETYSKGLSLRNQPKEIQRWIQAQFQTAKQKLLCDYLLIGVNISNRLEIA